MLLFPVRLSVLAPAELVPAHPEVIRAPIDGVIGQFHVQPNQAVKKGQLLFQIDPRPFQAVLDGAKGQVAQWEAKLVRAEADNERMGIVGLAQAVGHLLIKRRRNNGLRRL